ncbi:hypothetical protein Bca4012_089713 [Brassica carinata]|uniref:Glutaredoxin domain-containing protein n=1 Tax=Brassica oleracea TaxID=3712 RepID=A0A3P6FU31_BRAOL|nr:unnamed protein product [Brassica oleracea]
MRQYIHRLRQEGELGTEIIAVILSACKRVRLLPESIRLISKSFEEEEKPNLYETEDNKNKVVLYFTSLRGIRKTYEDCCCVTTVLRGYQVAVLIRGVHVGGMEEIKKLNDGGKLGEMLKGLPVCESVGACGCCGDPSSRHHMYQLYTNANMLFSISRSGRLYSIWLRPYGVFCALVYLTCSVFSFFTTALFLYLILQQLTT